MLIFVLGDRGHRYERAKNIHRGDVEEEREFYNMDEGQSFGSFFAAYLCILTFQ